MFFRARDSSFCEADKKLLVNPDLAAFFQEDVKETSAPGIHGSADEAILLFKDWESELDEIDVPVYVIHGRSTISHFHSIDARYKFNRLITGGQV